MEKNERNTWKIKNTKIEIQKKMDKSRKMKLRKRRKRRCDQRYIEKVT